MNERLILTRKDLRVHERHIDISSLGSEHFFGRDRQRLCRASYIIFIDDDGLSYWVMKNRFGKEERVEAVIQFCRNCSRSFKKHHNELIRCCPYCDHIWYDYMNKTGRV